MCWAYSCATMVRTECRRLVNHLFQNGKISEERKNGCLTDKSKNKRKFYSLDMLQMDPSLVDEFNENSTLFMDGINAEKTHVEIRNLAMMILLPKKLHFDGEHQAAFLRAAVSRVSKSR